ncbi:MBL fold metallo-hydrolase [Streptomyces sp. NPDC056161]|uniref:MBL fold metallo-hydrolase n=1 Tax=Streptomyces sp. NPDC056161 TaxID=3345732 RepID=UPI0035D64362
MPRWRTGSPAASSSFPEAVRNHRGRRHHDTLRRHPYHRSRRELHRHPPTLDPGHPPLHHGPALQLALRRTARENGLCFLVETFTESGSSTILFDAGLTSEVVLHNARHLGVDLHEVEAVVLSHGHPDHFGGINGVLRAIGHPTPVVVHPDAFDPRMIVTSHTTLPMINIGLTREGIRASGGQPMEARGSVPLGPGLRTSGEMRTTADFEFEAPAGRLCVHADGRVEADDIEDHQVLGIDVEGHGLIVIDPCGHRGVVSSVEHMRALTGTEKVHGVLGGFHTGHPGISTGWIENTAKALAAYEPQLIAPMHCSGFPLKKAVSDLAPEAFALITAGTVLTIGDVPADTAPGSDPRPFEQPYRGQR